MKNLVKTSCGLFTLCLLPLCSYADSFVKHDGARAFKVYQTTRNSAMHEILTTPFSRHDYPELPTLDLDSARESHAYTGLGISLTDASAWLMSRMPQEQRRQFIQETFSEDGLGLSMIRLNCGSSDYATELYNYNDSVGDVGMKHFSVSRDELYLIPLIHEIRQQRPDLFIFSSVWSVPGWMKDSGTMCGGSLLSKYMPAFANYWASYLREYKKRGVDVKAITVQNEPMTDQEGGCPATMISASQEAGLVGKFLPEAFRKNGVKADVWIHDHNYKDWKRPREILADKQARKNAAAVAFHPYDGKPQCMDSLRALYPTLPFHLTERGPSRKDRAMQTEAWWCNLIFSILNHGCSSYTGWNLLLNEDGQPNTGKFWCDGLVAIGSDGQLTYSTQYRVFRHLGHFVKPGAVIMKTDFSDSGLSQIVFRNPDGKWVIAVGYDGSTTRKRLKIKYKGEYLTLCFPMDTWSVSTVVIDN